MAISPAHSEPPALTTVGEFEQLLEAQHPFAALLGIQIQEITHGRATLLMPRRSEHERLGGIIAGPMLMGLADLALYAAIMGGTGRPDAVTASLSINFLRGTPPGGVLAHARIIKTGRLTAGDVLIVPEAGGEAIAQAISTWSLPSRKPV